MRVDCAAEVCHAGLDAVIAPRPLSSLRVACAFVLALAPAALGWSSSVRLDGMSMLGWALVPWIALMGAPGLQRAWLPVAVFAPWPTLALGAALDARAGVLWGTLLPTGLSGALVIAALAALAARDRASMRPALYGASWIVLIVAPPLLVFAFEFGAGPGAAPRLFTWLTHASPFGWALERTADIRPDRAGWPWLPGLVIAWLALAPRAGARTTDSAP